MTITITEASCHKHQEKPTLLIILRMKKQKFHRFLVLRFRLTSKQSFVKIHCTNNCASHETQNSLWSEKTNANSF